jgi:hypothetical protein
MSVAEFWGQVAQCQRLLRVHRLVKDEVNKPSRAWRLARRILPWAVIPLVAIPWWSWVGLAVLGVVPLMILGQFSPWRLTTFEALRMPSRRALYAARLLRSLPWLLWVGLCGTASLLASRWAAFPDMVQVALYLLIGIQVPVLIVFLSGVPHLVPLRLMRSSFIISSLFWIPLFFLLSFGGFVAGQAVMDQLAVILAVMPLLLILLLALQAWGISRLEPMRQIHSTVQALGQGGVQEGAKPAPAPYVGKPATVGPWPLLSGRHGLGWAAAYYAFFRLAGNGVRHVLHSLFQLALLVFLVVFLACYNDLAGVPWLGFLYFYFLFCLSRSLLYLDDPQRLYLLGVDYRRQLIHRLTTLWLTPGLVPTCIGVPLAVLLSGETEMPFALLALAAGLTVFREGWFGWPLLHVGTSGSMVRMNMWAFALTLGLVFWFGFLVLVGRLAWLPGPDWDTPMRMLLFAAPCGAFGLAGIAYKWWCLDEATLNEWMHG